MTRTSISATALLLTTAMGGIFQHCEAQVTLPLNRINAASTDTYASAYSEALVERYQPGLITFYDDVFDDDENVTESFVGDVRAHTEDSSFPSNDAITDLLTDSYIQFGTDFALSQTVAIAYGQAVATAPASGKTWFVRANLSVYSYSVLEAEVLNDPENGELGEDPDSATLNGVLGFTTANTTITGSASYLGSPGTAVLESFVGLSSLLAEPTSAYNTWNVHGNLQQARTFPAFHQIQILFSIQIFTLTQMLYHLLIQQGFM